MAKAWILVEAYQVIPEQGQPGIGGQLPHQPNYPSHGLPGQQPQPGQLPSGGQGGQPNQPNYPSQGLPPPQASQLPPPDADVKPVPQSYVPLYNTQHGWYYVPVDAIKEDSGGQRPGGPGVGGQLPTPPGARPDQGLPPSPGHPSTGQPPTYPTGQPTPPQPGGPHVGGQLPPNTAGTLPGQTPQPKR